MAVLNIWFILGPLLLLPFNALVWITVLLPVAFIFMVHWTICRTLVWFQYGNQRKQLKGLEVGYLCDEESCRGTMACFISMNGPHPDGGDPEEAQRVFDQIMANHEELHTVISIPEKIHGYYFWRKVDKCCVEDHWALLDGVDPEKTYSHSDVMRLYAKVHNSPFPKDKPMWIVYYVPKFLFDEELGKPRAEPKSIYIIKGHHCVGDAIPVSRCMIRYFTDQKPKFNPVPPLRNKFSIKTFISFSLAIMNIPSTYASKKLTDVWNNTHFPRLSGQKFLHSFFADVDLVRFIRRKAGCRFSDIIMAALGASLHALYVREKVIRTYIVVANPSEPDDYTMCNYYLAAVQFPGEAMGHLERLRNTQRLLKETATSLEGYTLMWLIKVLGTILPKRIYHPIFRHMGALAYATYVPAAFDEHLTYNQRKIVGVQGTSIHREGCGFLVAVTSYQSKFGITFLVDGVLVDGKEKVVQDIADEFRNYLIQLGHILDYKGKKKSV